MAGTMLYDLKGPDGTIYTIRGPENADPYDLSDALSSHLASQAAAQKAHLEKTGFMPALKGAGRAALGSAAKFIGESTGSEAVKNYAKNESELAAQTYEPTTAEDISSAQGILPTASRWISQKVTEPIGGIAGRYGAPMVAGVAGAMLAPEVATTGLVGTALADALAANALRSTIASGVSTAATNFPSATGEVLERQEQAGTQKDMGAALMAGLVNSAIAAVGLPGTGPIAKALGPKLTEQAAVLAKDVIAGKITKDAAVKALASRTENYARAMAANAASGTGMMVGTEAATRAGAGQSLTDEEAMKAYGQSAVGALELAPIFGAFHGMGSRGAAMEKLAGAEQTRLRNEQDAADKIQAHHEATFGGNPDQLALAAQERGADVAGLEAAKASINAKYDEVLAKQQDKLTPAQKEHYDTYEAYDHLGVTSQSQLDSMPLEHLLDAKRILAEKDTPDTPKKMQPVYARIDAILTDTINNHPDTVKQTKDAEFDNVLAAKRAKEAQLAIDAQQARADRIDTVAERDKLEALKTAESRRLYNEKQDQLRALDEQTKPNVPDEMFPRTEAEAARNEQAQTEPLPDATSAVGDNQAIRQGSEPSVAVPEPAVLSESKKAEAVAPDTLGVTSGVPRGNAGRGKLAPEAEPVKLATDNKTASKTALEQIREVNDEALREEVSLPDRIVDAIHSALLEPVSKRNMEDWHENIRGALDAARHHIEVVKRARDNASPRGKVGSVLETQERKKLIEADSKIAQEELGSKTEQVLDKDVPDTDTTTVDPDAHLYSRKAKGEPKEAKEVVASTVNDIKSVVSEWFNPVWLRQALNKGWLHIVDGTMAESDLPAAVKAAHPEVKGVYVADNGHVYLFTKNIPKGAELGVILHEIGEHKGLENLIGADKVTQLANRVRNMAKGKGQDARIANEALKMAGNSDKELIAYFGEIAINKYKLRPNGKDNVKPAFGQAIAWINTLWNAIGKALEKLHFNIDTVKGQDVVDMLYGAARLEMGKEHEVKVESRTGDRPGEWVETDLGNGRSQLKFIERELDQKIMPSYGQRLTDAEEQAMKARGLTVFPQEKVETAREKIQNFMGGFQDLRDSLGVKIIGPLYAIHRKANEQYGPDNFYAKTTGKLLGSLSAQHTLNSMYFATGAVEHGTMTFHDKGYALIKEFDARGNKLANMNDLKDRWKDLHDSLNQDGHSDAMIQQYMNTMVFADRYKELIALKIKTPKEFTQESYVLAKQLQAKHRATYDAWRNTYNEIRQNKKEGLIKSGLFTAKKADEFLDRMEYIPLYRMTEGEGLDAVFMQSLVAAAREQKLKFGTEEYDVADPMGNIVKNEMWLYQRMMRNNTANLLADQYVEMGLGRYIKNPKKGDLNMVTFLKDGELKHFQVDNSNDMAIFVAAPVSHGLGVRIARAVSGTLRRMITITPSFAYRQMFDDAQRTWMQAGTNRSFMGTLSLSAKEQYKNRSILGGKETPLAHEGRMHGLVGQIDFQDSFNHWMDHMLDIQDDTWLKKLNKYVEKAEMFAQNSDLAARLSVFDAVKKEGIAKGEAADIAGLEGALRAQMMINFNHKGTASGIRTMLAMVPFINARIQSDWRLIDALKGNTPGLSKEKARQVLAMKVGQFAAFTVLYTMIRSGDADYEDSSDEARNRNFLFNVGGVPFKVPVAPEYMLLKASIEHTYRLSTDQEYETGEKLRQAMAAGAMNLITSPTDVMPTIVRPFLENITNHSFFTGRTLVSPSLQNADTNKQFVPGQTSEMAKWMSDIGQAIVGNDMNVSPIKIDNVLRGIFGTVGQDAAFTANMISNWASDVERPDAKLYQLPEVGAMFYNPEGGQRTADYYALRDRVMTRHATLLQLQKDNPAEARAYRVEHAKELRLVPQISAIGIRLAEIRKQQRAVNTAPSSKMDGAAKKAALARLTERQKAAVGDRVNKMLDQLD